MKLIALVTTVSKYFVPCFWLTIALSFSLVGCGGGGGGSSAPAASNDSESLSGEVNESLVIEEVQVPATTALADNPLSLTASFDNFETVQVSFDPELYPVQGMRRFLKVSDDLGLTLFLGEVHFSEPFSLEVNPQVLATRLIIEAFTESAMDETVITEVQL